MEKLIEGGSAFDDTNDDDLKPSEKPSVSREEGGLEFSRGTSSTRNYSGSSQPSPVGPKGVIADYNDAKRQMYFKHIKQQEDLKRTAVKNSFTVLSTREEDILAQKEMEVKQNLEEMIDDEDEFFKQYREKRMREWKEQQIKRYGELVHITRDDFLDEIDNEPTSTFIIVHLYETVSTYRMSY